MTHQENLMKCALAYAAKGWQVFPLHTIRDGECSCGNTNCDSPGKHPMTKKGLKNATADETQINEWWSKWPEANIGIRTGKESGLFVLDLDYKDDPEKDGIRSMAKLSGMSDHAIPQTPKVQTGSGGEHHYFKMPGSDLRNTAGKIAAGIDTRANGGYVVAPPSLHVSGMEYKWLIDPKASLVDLPKWMLAALDKKAGRKVKKGKKVPGEIKDGQRNSRLMSIAGSLRKQGLEIEDIEPALQRINTKKCNPPLYKDEVSKIAESAANYDPGTPHMPYRTTKNGLILLKSTQEGISPVPLTNFTAVIKSDVVHDDGVEKTQNFEIEVNLNGVTKTISVPASKFATLNWIIECMGSSAIVYAGYTSKDHTRVAIQMLSGKTVLRTVFKHTGWRKIDKKWFYFAGNGAIGTDGIIDSIEIGLPDGLEKYTLSKPKDNDELICAIRASLKLLDIVPDDLGFPLYCAIWRSILGGADYSIHISGPTGAGKSVIAALVQQHFGSGMTDRNLPGSWSSTANALEGLAFAIKDAIFVIDDFAPNGTRTDVQRLHNAAARIFRAQGNHSGRQRMRADGSLKATKPPRGLIISTGEDIPTGQSVRARLFTLELSGDDLKWNNVTACQSDAEKGLYEIATFGFIRWLAPRCEELKKKLAGELRQLRSKATQSDMHKRTPEIIASQSVGMKYFVEYAKDVGAITESKAEELLNRCWAALGQAGYKQIVFQSAMEPAQRFVELISSALSSGQAHLADKDGEEPENPSAYGWRKSSFGMGGRMADEWHPQGSQIGWTDGSDIYLDPDASFKVAQNFGGNNGLSITPATLRKRLKEKKLIIPDEKRETLTVRRTLQGRLHKVLFLQRDVLKLQEPDKPDDFDGILGNDDEIPI